MSTIASLISLLGDTGIKPYADQELTANRIQFGNTQNQTGLIELQRLKESQAAEAQLMQAIQTNPALAQQLFGTIATLPTTGGPPPSAGAGPMTQQPFGPGGAGPTQTVPGGQDLSQFVTQGGQPTPTPTLATIGPQQPQLPGPPNPVLEMARTNPRAAMMLSQQLEGRQDAAVKRQEQRLKMGTAVMESLGRRAQGATDQASWDLFLQDAASIDPQLAARLPRVYSKEARERVIAQAVDVKDSLTLQVEELKAQSALMKARREQANIPNYTGDAQLDALIYTRMKDQPPGTMPSREIVDAAVQQREADKLKVSERQGIQAAEVERTAKPLEGAAGKDASNLQLLRTMTDDIAALRKDDFTGPIVGRTGYVREQAGRMDPQETAFRSTLQNMKDILGRLRSGANIPAPEMANLERLLPTVNDLPGPFQAKMQSFQRALEQQLESITRVGTTGRQRLREETKPTTPRVGEQPQGQSTSQAPTATSPGTTFTDADIAATLANPANKGKTRQQVIDAARAKGLTYKER